MPTHCYLWTPQSSGSMSFPTVDCAVYYSIPLTLAWFVAKRRDVDFRWMFVCFAVFILACGTTHLMEIGTCGMAITGSPARSRRSRRGLVPTAFLLTRLIRSLALAKSERARGGQWEPVARIAARKTLERELHEANEHSKTCGRPDAELQAANAKLRASSKRTGPPGALDEACDRRDHRFRGKSPS